jgi:HSF-type DNA-binding
MLKENEEVISFVPGYRSNTKTVLGRIVVHDRVSVESNVLPRYFNHNSFASLRRQLNYFSFVRLGKGRQRESTYLNDSVIELDDILTLKRRSSGSGGPRLTILSATLSMGSRREPNLIPKSTPQPEQKRKTEESPLQLLLNRSAPPPVSPKRRIRRSGLSSCSSIVSDDEQSQGQQDLRRFVDPGTVHGVTDDDIIAGCSALLGLAAQGWGCS